MILGLTSDHETGTESPRVDPGRWGTGLNRMTDGDHVQLFSMYIYMHVHVSML